MKRIALSKKRPSRPTAIGFGMGIAGAAALTVGLVVADFGGRSPEASVQQDVGTPSPIARADPNPSVPGLRQLAREEVPPEGLIVRGTRVRPTGSESDYSYRDVAREGESIVIWLSSDGTSTPVELLMVPISPAWSVIDRGAEMARAANGGLRVLAETLSVRVQGLQHDWLIESGTVAPGAVYYAGSIGQRADSNFLYESASSTFFVRDRSPQVTHDRVWLVRGVVNGRWFSMNAPVVEFQLVAEFMDALVAANR